MAKVKIRGEKELYAKLKKLPERIKDAEKRAIKSQTDETADDLRRNAPVDDGELVEGIQEEILSGGLTGRAALTARHSEFVVHGTSDTPANDFVTGVIQRTRQDFPDRLRDELNDEIRKL